MPKALTPDGVEIFYEVRGTGPINLAFVHGWGGGGGLWYQVARHLDGLQFSSWLIDLRGHGRSSAPAFGYEWDNVAQDILAVADHAVAERFLPVGSSLGGKITLYLTAKFEARCPALVLVSPVGPGPAPFSIERRRELIESVTDWRQLKANIHDWFGPGVDEATIDACCRAVSRTPRNILEITAEKFLYSSLPEAFDRTDAPTLVVIGERDPNYGPEYQKTSVLPFLARADTVTLPCGHFAPMENPAELAALISDFARAHWTPSASNDSLRP